MLLVKWICMQIFVVIYYSLAGEFESSSRKYRTQKSTVTKAGKFSKKHAVTRWGKPLQDHLLLIGYLWRILLMGHKKVPLSGFHLIPCFEKKGVCASFPSNWNTSGILFHCLILLVCMICRENKFLNIKVNLQLAHVTIFFLWW